MEEELRYKIREIESRILNLKKFVTKDLVDIINSRVLHIEEELERLKKELDKKIQYLEEKLKDLEITQEEAFEYQRLKEKLEKRIDKNILNELD